MNNIINNLRESVGCRFAVASKIFRRSKETFLPLPEGFIETFSIIYLFAAKILSFYSAD